MLIVATKGTTTMKTLLAAALLAASTAYAGDWTVTFKSLQGDQITGIDALFDVSGSFSGTDNNGDGFITTDELTSVVVFDDKTAFPFRQVGFDETWRPYMTGFARINFDIQALHLLDFRAFSFDGQTRYDMGLQDGAFTCQAMCWGATFGAGSSVEVRLAVSSAQSANPVPEPQTWALMLAGLTALAGSARRRSTAPRRRPWPRH
jgi:hypothetical protein